MKELRSNAQNISDLKCMTKVVSAVLILRNGKAPGWTTELDDQLVAWTREYIKWLESSPISLEEKASTKSAHSLFCTCSIILTAI